MKGKYIGLSGKAWIGILALGVVVYIVVRRRAKAASSAAPASATDSIGTDPTNQAQLAAGLGGTPGGDSSQWDPGWFQATLDAQTQSLEDFIALSGGLAGSGISGAGGAGTSGGGVGAAAPSSAGAAAPSTAPTSDPTQPALVLVPQEPGTPFLPNPGATPTSPNPPSYQASPIPQPGGVPIAA